MENNIKSARTKAKLTQKELSAASGVMQNKISLYEGLESLDNVTLGTLRKLSEALGVTVNDLVYPSKEGK